LASNVNVVGFALGAPDLGVSWNEAYGGFNVNFTDEGAPVRSCESVTLVGFCPETLGSTSATVVPSAIPVPATAIPTVTPLASAKCKIGSGPSVEAGELVDNEKEYPGVPVPDDAIAAPSGNSPRNITTVPSGT
jgi:hypothetical protein